MSSAPTLAPATPMGQAAEQLVVRLRPDLIVQPQFYEGMTHYVVKDPIALKYFRFKVEEYFLLQQLDGKQNLQDVKRAFERKYRPQTISVDDLIRFVAQLHEAGIVLVDTSEQAKVFIERRRKRLIKQVGQFFANILYIKIPIIDPERLLDRMYPWFRWMFTTWFVVLSFMMMGAALLLVLSQWSTFSTKLPDFQNYFNWWTILNFWCTLAIVKIIHEFGHGLTAKHFGGEVHEMGMLFLVMTPALYCDVTDSWLLPNKWKRIWISAAGIFVECFLASIATFVWWNTEAGLLNSLSMATMFICSVNTILFNANPLLRYDGYYVMSDWLEIPNLRVKSTQFFGYLFQEKVLGLEVPVQSYMPRSRRILFVTYAIASYLYRWVVTFSILFFLYGFLKPHGLGSISMVLAIASLVPLLFMPVYQIVKFVRTPGRMRKVKKVRAALCAAAFAAVVTGILMIPTPMKISGSLVLMSAEPAFVYAEVPGILAELKVRDGDYVVEGQVIAVVASPEKQREREALEEQQKSHSVLALWYKQSDSLAMRGRMLQHQNAAADLEPALNKVQEQLDSLILAAPRSGKVIGVPHPETLGMAVKPGKPFCEVTDPKKLEAHLILDQSDIELINMQRDKSATAWVKIYGSSERTYRSFVDRVALPDRDNIPPELSSVTGGEIATKQDPKTGEPIALTAMYEVTIPIDNSDLHLEPGQRGFAKIDGGTHSLGWWLWRLIVKTFHFTL